MDFVYNIGGESKSMIIIYLGGIGSGKTISAVRDIYNHPDNFPYTGFALKKMKHHRLIFDDIIISDVNKSGKKVPVDVNWNFWKTAREEHKNFSIYLDEAHNIISSRSSMSRRNKLMSNWISQIRKILYTSPKNHIHIISQTYRRLDINFRELAHVFVECKSMKMSNGAVWVKQEFFNGIDDYMMNKRTGRCAFLANPFFRFYNTYEIDDMGSGEEYI